MLKRFKQVLAALLCCASCTPAVKPPPKLERWAVYYDTKLTADAFKDYDLVVFDRQYHPDISPLKHKTICLAYVSAGEAHGDAPELEKLRDKKALFKPNKQWGSHVVNLTSAEWRSIVMEQVADALNQGFDGVMIDTLDSPLHASAELSDELGEANKQAAIQLVKDIRQTHPDIKIMLNRGFSILPDVSPQLDFILAESVLSETNVSTGQSELFPPSTYIQVIRPLLRARRQSPQLKIMTLDYWKQDDVDGIQFLYAVHRKHGLIPYVTTPDLRQLSLEPHRQQRNRHAIAEPITTEKEDPDA